MDRRTAKEFLHLRDWLARAQEIVDAGSLIGRLPNAGAECARIPRKDAKDGMLHRVSDRGSRRVVNALVRTGVVFTDITLADGEIVGRALER
jgi:hypothetical protein